MASYKERVAQDLDRWIAAGHVAGDQREAILQSIPDARRLDAAAAMAWVGAVLLGVALVAFISANWDLLPRAARFAIVLGVYAAGAGAAAWSIQRGRPNIANGLLTFAALAFAAAIGLTGQIFDIVGEPRAALYASGIAAAALALAGRSSGAAIAAVLLIGVSDFLTDGLFRHRPGFGAPWLLAAAPAAGALAVWWRSAPLAHAAALGAIASAIWLAGRVDAEAASLLVFSAALAVLAGGGRWLRERGGAWGGVFYGWFAWAAMGFFIAGGYADHGHGLGAPHRLAWLLLAGGVIALGRHDRHALVTAAGVLGLIGAIAALLGDLGLDLMAAAAVFALAALMALAVALVVRRRAK